MLGSMSVYRKYAKLTRIDDHTINFEKSVWVACFGHCLWIAIPSDKFLEDRRVQSYFTRVSQHSMFTETSRLFLFSNSDWLSRLVY